MIQSKVNVQSRYYKRQNLKRILKCLQYKRVKETYVKKLCNTHNIIRKFINNIISYNLIYHINLIFLHRSEYKSNRHQM